MRKKEKPERIDELRLSREDYEFAYTTANSTAGVSDISWNAVYEGVLSAIRRVGLAAAKRRIRVVGGAWSRHVKLAEDGK